MLAVRSSAPMDTLPTATARQSTFFSWNLMVAFNSSTLLTIVRVSDHRRKLAGFVQSGPQNTGNLLDERVRRHERVVFLGEFLDQLFVLVHLLQRFLVHARDSVGGGLIAMLLIPQNANGELGPGDVTKLDGTGETLFLLGIVVLQINLKFDGLEELPVLGLRQLQH